MNFVGVAVLLLAVGLVVTIILARLIAMAADAAVAVLPSAILLWFILLVLRGMVGSVFK